MNDTRTFAAQLTPAGRGAVATIAVRGPGAATMVARYFSPPASVSAPINRIRFGRWQRERADSGEELVICRTGSEEIEIHCHGGSAATEAILADLQAAGAEIIAWQAWTALTANDDVANAALLALAEAQTERTATILLDQYRGALKEEFDRIQSLLSANDHQEALQRIDRLLERATIGMHLTKPFRVVLAGAPNVGKSSLINVLLGYGRSIVFDEPGTTRDVVSALTALDGWPVELSDTAGIRKTSDQLEAAGVERASRQLAAADLIVWVTDASAGTFPALPAVTATPVLAVRNKIDLLLRVPSDPGIHSVSATTGAGMEALKASIVGQLVRNTPAPGEPIPFTASQIAMLQRWREQAVENGGGR